MIAMDVSKYRKRYEAELAKAAAPKPRQRAGTRALTAGKSASAAARAKAIKTAPLEQDDLGERVTELLATLRNRKEPLTVRTAALQALGALDFLGPRFAPFRADYKQALREIATDPQVKLRESALELLAIDKDPYAQELLLRGLKKPNEAIVSDAKAIQFLGYDDHAEVVPLARQVYKRSTGATREEALRVLATDPKSERLFTRLLKDKSEQSSIRLISASGLQSLNPDAFEKTARKIVADDSDYNEIRATSLTALAHGREAREKPADPKFVNTVQQLTKTTRSPALRSSIQRFLQSTQK
jgi:hypothetical protein